jgi:hypothetical protein
MSRQRPTHDQQLVYHLLCGHVVRNKHQVPRTVYLKDGSLEELEARRSQGEPGSMNRVVTPKSASHSRTAGHELGSIVASYVLGDAVRQEEFRESVEHVVAPHPPRHPDGQTLPGVFVDHREQTELSAVTRGLTHEVISPDVVWVLGPQPDAGAIGQPQPASFGLPSWHLETFFAPDALHSFGVEVPAGHLQKAGDASVAVAAKAASQGHNSRGQGVLILA